MADISDVNVSVIKDLYQRLEGLTCMFYAFSSRTLPLLTMLARIMTRVLY